MAIIVMRMRYYNYIACLAYKCACSWNKHINKSSEYLAVCRVRQQAGCYKKQSRYRHVPRPSVADTKGYMKLTQPPPQALQSLVDLGFHYNPPLVTVCLCHILTLFTLTFPCLPLFLIHSSHYLPFFRYAAFQHVHNISICSIL